MIFPIYVTVVVGQQTHLSELETWPVSHIPHRVQHHATHVFYAGLGHSKPGIGRGYTKGFEMSALHWLCHCQSKSTRFAFRFEHRKWNRGRNGMHQLGQPVAPSVPFPVFKSEGEPGRLFAVLPLHCIIKQRTGLGMPRILT